MSLLILEIENFKSIISGNYEIDEGFVRLKGLSQTGKTTIFSAIEWTLYKASIGVSPDINPKAKTQVTLTLPSDKIVITRKKGSKPNLLVLYEEKKYEEEAGQGIINSLYGSYNVWKSSCYLDQYTISNFLQEMSSKDKMKLLEELFLLYDTSCLEDNIKKKISSLSSLTEKLKSDQHALETKLKKYPGYKHTFEIDYPNIKKQKRELTSSLQEYKIQLSTYNKYLSERNNLDKWIKENSNIEEKCKNVVEYEKWKKAEKIIKELGSYSDISIEEVDDLLSNIDEIDNAKNQLLKIELEDKISCLEIGDIENLKKEISILEINYKKQKQYNRYSSLLNTYKVSDVKELEDIAKELLLLEKASKLTSLDNIEKLLSIPEDIEEKINYYNLYTKYKDINLENQKKAFIQKKYERVWNVLSSHEKYFPLAEELLKKYSYDELALSSKKLKCPSCQLHLHLQGDHLVLAPDVNVNEETLFIMKNAPKDISLTELKLLFSSKHKLLINENEFKIVENIVPVDKPEYTLKDVEVAKKLKKINPNIEYKKYLKFSSTLHNDVTECNSIANSTYVDEIENILSSLNENKSLLEKYTTNIAKINAYKSSIPSVEINKTKEELKNITNKTLFSAKDLIRIRDLKNSLFEIGEISIRKNPGLSKESLDVLLKEYNYKKTQFENLVEELNPGDDIYSNKLKEIEEKIEKETIKKICYDDHNNLKEVKIQLKECQEENELYFSIRDKIDKSKRECIESRIGSLNSVLEERSSEISKYLTNSINVNISSISKTKKGEKRFKPSINVCRNDNEVKVKDLCGIEIKLIPFILTWCLSEFNNFPVILIDEVFAYTDDDKIDDILEYIKISRLKSMIIIIHRFDSDIFDSEISP